ncbi:MAG: DUF1501 domain-containing protein [Planctomycetota bacterium]|nr:DUF1501 domain-containing protein [Planctomycetota bacterium]
MSSLLSQRRHMIRSLAAGGLLLPGVLSELIGSESTPGQPLEGLAPKQPHFPARARRVIFLFLTGGVSHIDTFDDKPLLRKYHDQPRDQGSRYCKASMWRHRAWGESGIRISDLFPEMARMADDLCLIRSMKNINGDHFGATIGIHTGSATFNRPSMGSWVSYGLGTENQNLPSFMVVSAGIPYGGGQNWGADFLPVLHQGTQILPGRNPIANIKRRSVTRAQQQTELNLLEYFNQQYRQGREVDANLAARMKSFETAAAMQIAAPEAFRLDDETQDTRTLYGLRDGDTTSFAWQCLVARRLAERGVRFIELIDGDTSIDKNWDAHANLSKYPVLARNVDRPIAALLSDLKRRGMLDETLVVLTSEFGRGPFVPTPGTDGRGHHARCYSSWVAGGGVKGGITYGASDEFGDDVAENVVTAHDFQATLLHQLGIDHERLTYRHAGRDYRLTDVHGKVVHEILA